MVKLASIDLGSNSTRLLIAEVNDQGLNVLTLMHIVTKMSEKIEQTGVISTEAFKRVNSALRNFKKLLIVNDVDDVFVVFSVFVCCVVVLVFEFCCMGHSRLLVPCPK